MQFHSIVETSDLMRLNKLRFYCSDIEHDKTARVQHAYQSFDNPILSKINRVHCFSLHFKVIKSVNEDLS